MISSTVPTVHLIVFLITLLMEQLVCSLSPVSARVTTGFQITNFQIAIFSIDLASHIFVLHMHVHQNLALLSMKVVNVMDMFWIVILKIR